MAAQKTTEQAKEAFLLSIKAGAGVEEAARNAGRTRKTYENWRAQDKDFAAKVDAARERRDAAKERGKDPDLYNLSFADWRKRFLNADTYPHQHQWIDVLEGRTPKEMHHSVRMEVRDPDRIIINTPPGHAKSTTITAQYATFKLCMNPAFRIIIISKTKQIAAEFLYQIRTYLTSPDYVELQEAYAPADGFKPQRGDGQWSSNVMYLSGRSADAADKAAKDPNVTALGIGGQVYGKRADLIIVDDAVTGDNVDQYEKQFKWLTREVLSRGLGMKVLIVGTRIAPLDLYSYLLDGGNYAGDGETPWTYLAQPAVLEYGPEPEDWVTLWPRSSQPYDNARPWEKDENGLYPAMDGTALARIRNQNSPSMWALVYQQQQVSEDMTFHPKCVWGSVDKRRKPGPLRPGEWGGRRAGMEGMHTTLSIDPAGTGEAFLLMYAVDRQTRERWVLDAWTSSNTKISWYREKIEQLWDEYRFMDLVIEKQGYSNWLYQDEQLVEFCRQRGIRSMPHYTGVGNKIDPDFGVASLSGLFGSLQRRDSGAGERTGQEDHAGDNIIHLPDPGHSPDVKALIDQLITWVPGKSGAKLRQDGPMALWFAELRARTILFGTKPDGGHAHNFVAGNRFLTERHRRRQIIRPVFMN